MASVVFMGTPDFAAGILKSLIVSGHEVKAVFSQPDRPKGRKGIVQMPPVKELALEHQIPVFQPQKIRSGENALLIRDIRPDFIVVAAFGQIIPQEILDIPPYGCLNVHASLLPAWRGAAPIQWSILQGDSMTGVTIMRMDAGLDTGDIIQKQEVEIRPDETGDSLFERLMEAGEALLPRAMEQILDGSAVYTPQPLQSTTPYAKMLTRQSGLIDWSMDAVQIERMVRAYNSWPGTYTFLHSKMLKILRAVPVPEERRTAVPVPEERQTAGQEMVSFSGGRAALPGEILLAKKDDLVVKTGSGALRLLEVQLEGKKRMEAGAFLRGCPLQAGDVLTQERV